MQLHHKTLALGISVSVAVLVAQGIMAKHDEQIISSNVDQILVDCLPSDTQTQSVLSLKNQAGKLSLNCEKHHVVHWGQAVKPAVSYVVALE